MAKMIFRDADWVWNALVKQFEAETGLKMASVEDEVRRRLGPNLEYFVFEMDRLGIGFKGVEFEIEEEDDDAL